MKHTLRCFYLFASLLLGSSIANAQLTGTISVPGAYPDLASTITALNTQGVGAGGVVINLAASSPQTAPAGGYKLGSALLNASVSATNTITINGTGNTVTAYTGTSTTVDGIFFIMGTDYVTINGLNLSENALNLTATTAMEWGYAMVNLNASAPFDGCQNNTIKNCTITLNRTIATPSVAIYSNHIVSSSNVALVITAAGDLHSNNKIYSNTITNVTTGIYLLGYAAPSTVLYDQNNDIGGSSAATGNTITNFAGTNFTGVGGITAVYQQNANVSYNTMNNMTNGGASAVGGVWGIYPYGAGSTFTVNNNSVSLTGASINTLYYLYGIYSNALTTNLTAQNNTISLTQAAGTAAVPLYGIFFPNGTNLTASTNDVTINQSLSGALYGIYTTAIGTVTINNNTIKENTTAAVSSTCYMIYAGATAVTENITNNKINNVTLNTTGAVYLIYASNSTPTVNITGNSITTGFTRTASGTTYCVYNFGSPTSGTSTISNNNFSNITTTGAGSTYGFYYFTASGHNHNFSSDTLSNWTSAGGAAQFYLIYCPSGTTNTVANNNFNNITSTYNGTCYISYVSGTTSFINNNTFSNITNGGASIYGIYSLATTANIFSNNINKINSNTSTSGSSYGLYVSSGTTVNVYNNMISDITAPASSGTSPVYGMYFSSGTTMKVFHNTVNMNPVSTGASFGATGIYYSSGISSFDFRNNIIRVNATPVGSGYVVALLRSFGSAAVPPANLATTTNGNIYYAPNAANSYLYAEGSSIPLVNAYNLTNDPNLNTGGCAGTSLYKAFMTPRETQTFTENNLTQIGTTGTYAPTGASYAKGNGVATSAPAVTTDLNGITRPVPPDAGALQFTGTAAVDVVPPVISYTPLPTPTYCTGGPTLSVVIGDASGVNTTSNPPRLYYRKSTEADAFGVYPGNNVSSFNGWKYVNPSNTTSPFLFTIDYSKLTAAIAPNDTIIYFVVAQDNATSPNVGSSTVGYAAGYCPTSVNLVAAAGPTQATPLKNRYSILAQPALPNVTPATSTICQGNYAALTATSASSSIVATIGTGTIQNSTTSYPTPWGAYWTGNHQQYLILASELSAAGLTAGNLTSIAFDQGQGYIGGVLQNYQISLANSTQTAVTSTFQSTGFSVVYTNPSYTPPAATGWVTVPFGTPFFWNGSSNIMVDVIHMNCPNCPLVSCTSYTSNGVVNQSATSFPSSYSVYYDGNCSVITFAPTGTFSFTGPSNQRPNMRFAGGTTQPVAWTPTTGLYTNTSLTTPYVVGDTNFTVFASPTTTTTYFVQNLFVGCVSANSTTSATVNVLPAPPTTITAGGSTSFCAGNPISLALTAPAGYSYQWKLNGTNITGATTQVYTATAAGTYTVTTTNTSTGCSATTPAAGAITIVVNPIPSATITANTTLTFCTGGSVVLNAPAAPVGNTYTYIWNLGGVPITGATGLTYTATGTGNYTVKVTNAATGCFAITSPPTVVTVGPPPAAPITPSGPVTICQNTSTQFKTNSAGGLIYQWYLGGVPAPTTFGPANDSVYNAGSAGTYTVTVSSGPGCTSTSSGAVVNVNPAPPATITASGAPTTFCQGSSVTLTGSSAAGLTVQWYNGNTIIAGATNPIYSASVTGNYKMIVTNTSTLCANTSNIIPVTVNALPVATITPATSPSLCPGGTVVLNGNAGTGLTYQWFNNASPISGATTVSYTANAAGTYTLMTTNTATGCTNTSAGLAVIVNPAPSTAVTPTGPVNICPGTTITMNGPAAPIGSTYAYQWKNPANIAGATASSYSTGSAGTYTLQVTNTTTGCVATSAATTVTVLPAPAVSIAPTTPTTGCDSVNLTSVASGVLYQWKLAGIGILGATSSGYTARTSGSYTLTVTDNSTGCTTTSPAVTITVNPSPIGIITYSSPLVFCEGAAVVLNTPTGASQVYEWRESSNPIAGATGPNYITNQSGVYTIKVTNTATGCSKISQAVVVKVNPLPSPVIALAGNTLSTTTPYILYQWYLNTQPIPGASTATYNPLENGAYAVSVTDSNGCTNLSSLYFVNSLGIGGTSLSGKVKVYPNPTSGIVHVDAPVKVKLMVKDVSGKTVFTAQQVKEINLNNLADGMYLLYISTMEGQLIKAEKITKTAY